MITGVSGGSFTALAYGLYGDKLFADARYVFHFAGIGDIVPSIERPAEYMSANVQGTVSVLEAARHAGVAKLVYAASSSCYGLADTPTREDHPIRPQYPYALSKYQGEQAVFHWGQVYKLPVNSIRIFNAYGTRSRTSGAYGAVFGVFLRQKLAGKPYTVVGDGSQRRDFLYVTDIAAAFLAAAETKITGRTWNLGAGKPQSVNRLVELLGGERTHIPKRPGEPDCTWADIARISSELGWQPKVPFEEGVAQIGGAAREFERHVGAVARRGEALVEAGRAGGLRRDREACRDRDEHERARAVGEERVGAVRASAHDGEAV